MPEPRSTVRATNRPADATNRRADSVARHRGLLPVLAVTAVLAWASTPALAADEPRDGAIHGIVTADTGDGPHPVAQALVLVVGLGRTATTDADGSFRFEGVPAGEHEVLASWGDMVTRRQRIRVEGGEAAELRFDLAFGAEEEIVVTATRTSKGLADVPIRTEVVSRQLMEDISARTLADAIEFTTGVRVESNCQNCNFSQIRLLGLEGPYTQILIDSQPVISSLAQVYGIEQIPTRMVERIEVVKGGGSALYGPGSVGGVVNVIPREPRRTGFGFSTGVDVLDDAPTYTNAASFDWVSRDRRTFLTGFAQVDRINPFDANDDGFTEIARRDLEAFGVRLNRYFFDHDAKLTVDANRIHEERRGGDRLDLPPEETLITEWIDTERYGASVGWMHKPGESWDYRLTASLADTGRDSYYGTFMDPNAFGNTSSHLSVLDAQVNHYFGKHAVSWGVQASREDLLDRQPAYDRITDELYTNVGVFVQDDWSFARGWAVLLGVRADKHSEIDSVIASPRAALIWSPRAALDLRASVARGFRAPQAFDEDLHLSSVGGEVRIIRLAEELHEESSTNYMLGAEWKPDLWGGQALLEVNGFYTRLTELFNVQEDDDPATRAFEFLKVNFGGADVYGVEANLGWGIGDDLVLQGGLVVQRARFDQPEPDFGSRDFFRTPDVYGNATFTWSGRLARLFVGARYTGPMVTPHYAGFIPEDAFVETPSFLTLDVTVSKPLEVSGQRVVLDVGVKNLTDAYQDDFDRGPLRDADYIYGPRSPRSLRAGLRVEF